MGLAALRTTDGMSASTAHLTVVSLGADLTGVETALRDAGITIQTQGSGLAGIHLLPYGDALGVITDLDSPPIAWLSYPLNAVWLLTAIRTAAALLRSNTAVAEARVLLEICRAMASERDVRALHGLILRKARELTNADAGSLFLLEENAGEPVLRFAAAQTGPHDEGHYAGGILTLSDASIAGRVGMTGHSIRIADVYAELPAGLRFDDSFDKANDYRTKSMLCVPVRNFDDEIVGVLQIVNRKPTFDLVLRASLTAQLVTPFDEHDEDILTALAAQAGVALDNARGR